MDIYQHDSGRSFRLVVRGKLDGDCVRELEQAWNTAQSILAGKELVIDLSGVTNADRPAFDLLSRMRDSGARVTPALPSQFEEALSSSERRRQPSGRDKATLFRKLVHGIRGTIESLHG
jgi:ABC-type transporter Mla MlaB component